MAQVRFRFSGGKITKISFVKFLGLQLDSLVSRYFGEAKYIVSAIIQ